MTVRTAAVSVGTAPTALHAVDNAYGSHINEQSIEVANVSTVTVYYGGDDVTMANGVPIGAGAARTFDLAAGEVLYAVVAAGNAEVRVGRIGVG